MHRKLLLEKLGNYHPVDDADQIQLQRFVEFVNERSDCFERSLKIGHITGSVWLVDPSAMRVLLTHHRKLDKWVQLGGHSDGDPDTLAVALREAREESGIQGIEPLSEAIFDLDIHPIPANKNEPEHLHYDVRFAVQARSDAFVVTDESWDLAWVAIDELHHYATEDAMLRMAHKWKTQFAERF